MLILDVLLIGTTYRSVLRRWITNKIVEISISV